MKIEQQKKDARYEAEIAELKAAVAKLMDEKKAN